MNQAYTNRSTVKAIVTKNFSVTLSEVSYGNEVTGEYEVAVSDGPFLETPAVFSDLSLALLVFDAKVEYMEGN